MGVDLTEDQKAALVAQLAARTGGGLPGSSVMSDQSNAPGYIPSNARDSMAGFWAPQDRERQTGLVPAPIPATAPEPPTGAIPDAPLATTVADRVGQPLTPEQIKSGGGGTSSISSQVDRLTEAQNPETQPITPAQQVVPPKPAAKAPAAAAAGVPGDASIKSTTNKAIELQNRQQDIDQLTENLGRKPNDENNAADVLSLQTERAANDQALHDAVEHGKNAKALSDALLAQPNFQANQAGWLEHGAGHNIAAIADVVLHGLLNPFGVVSNINAHIDQDVAKQRAIYEQSRGDLEGKLKTETGLYAEALKAAGGDPDVARKSISGALAGATARMIESRLPPAYRDEKQRLASEQLINGLKIKERNDFDAAATQRAENQSKLGGAAANFANANKTNYEVSTAKKIESLYGVQPPAALLARNVPGYGIANDEESAKKAREANADFGNLQAAMKQYGTSLEEPVRGHVPYVNLAENRTSAANGLKIAAAKYLGVARAAGAPEGTQNAINELINSGQWSNATRPAAMQLNLERLRRIVEPGHRTVMRSYGLNVAEPPEFHKGLKKHG